MNESKNCYHTDSHIQPPSISDLSLNNSISIQWSRNTTKNTKLNQLLKTFIYKQGSQITQTKSKGKYLYKCSPLDYGSSVICKIYSNSATSKNNVEQKDQNNQILMQQKQYGPIELENNLQTYQSNKQQSIIKIILNKNQQKQANITVFQNNNNNVTSITKPQNQPKLIKSNKLSIKVTIQPNQLNINFTSQQLSSLQIIKLYNDNDQDNTFGIFVYHQNQQLLNFLKQMRVSFHYGKYLKITCKDRLHRDVILWQIMQALDPLLLEKSKKDNIKGLELTSFDRIINNDINGNIPRFSHKNNNVKKQQNGRQYGSMHRMEEYNFKQYDHKLMNTFSKDKRKMYLQQQHLRKTGAASKKQQKQQDQQQTYQPPYQNSPVTNYQYNPQTISSKTHSPTAHQPPSKSIKQNFLYQTQSPGGIPEQSIDGLFDNLFHDQKPNQRNYYDADQFYLSPSEHIVQDIYNILYTPFSKDKSTKISLNGNMQLFLKQSNAFNNQNKNKSKGQISPLKEVDEQMLNDRQKVQKVFENYKQSPKQQQKKLQNQVINNKYKKDETSYLLRQEFYKQKIQYLSQLNTKLIAQNINLRTLLNLQRQTKQKRNITKMAQIKQLALNMVYRLQNQENLLKMQQIGKDNGMLINNLIDKKNNQDREALEVKEKIGQGEFEYEVKVEKRPSMGYTPLMTSLPKLKQTQNIKRNSVIVHPTHPTHPPRLTQHPTSPYNPIHPVKIAHPNDIIHPNNTKFNKLITKLQKQQYKNINNPHNKKKKLASTSQQKNSQKIAKKYKSNKINIDNQVSSPQIIQNHNIRKLFGIINTSKNKTENQKQKQKGKNVVSNLLPVNFSASGNYHSMINIVSNHTNINNMTNNNNNNNYNNNSINNNNNNDDNNNKDIHVAFRNNTSGNLNSNNISDQFKHQQSQLVPPHRMSQNGQKLLYSNNSNNNIANNMINSNNNSTKINAKYNNINNNNIINNNSKQHNNIINSLQLSSQYVNNKHNYMKSVINTQYDKNSNKIVNNQQQHRNSDRNNTQQQPIQNTHIIYNNNNNIKLINSKKIFIPNSTSI